jgi:uncharacterized protein YceH (UPF0502 family)
MTEDNSTEVQPAEAPPRWQPLVAIDRRVAGVLAEKAKTTPGGYPMSLNAICTACNQKSNRAPVMNLKPEDVEESLDRLRSLGAVGMIEGYGRVTKYRHYLYEWLGVDKVELAVMTELLLRGAQTEGELRGRAARMEPIHDLAALRPVLGSLKSKALVIPLTPEGRGHVVAHALYQPRELETVKAQYGAVAAAGSATFADGVERALPAGEPFPPRPTSQPAVSAGQAPPWGEFRRDIDQLRGELAQLRNDLEKLSDHQQQTEQDLRKLSDALGT